MIRINEKMVKICENNRLLSHPLSLVVQVIKLCHREKLCPFKGIPFSVGVDLAMLAQHIKHKLWIWLNIIDFQNEDCKTMLRFFTWSFLSHLHSRFTSARPSPPSAVTALVAATTVWRSPRNETLGLGVKHVISRCEDAKMGKFWKL